MPAQSTALRQTKSETSPEIPSASRSKERIFKFVRHHEIPEYERLGWTVHRAALAGTHHGHYSHLCEWCGDGEPIYP